MSHPREKDVQGRLQTQHKLEAMSRYYGTWPSIIAKTVGQYPFCPTRMYVVDTHAGSGAHTSEADPNGAINGTPMLAAFHGRSIQRSHRGVRVFVRATDIDAEVASALDARMAPLRGEPPMGLDVTAKAMDWRDAVPDIVAEIGREDHQHGGLPGSREHLHRSLWFIDPYGVESIDHGVIMRLPAGSEVIVNLDLMTLERFVGRGLNEERPIVAILDRVFGGAAWRRLGDADAEELARSFVESFPRERWPHRQAHMLRATGSQARALAHLTSARTAAVSLAAKVRTALTTGTIVKHTALALPEKGRAAVALAGRYAGLSLTIPEMIALESGYNRGQLTSILQVAEERGLGSWSPDSGSMTWFTGPARGLLY